MERSALEDMARVEAEHWWFRGRRRIIRSVLRAHLPARPARILEVGAGTGGNLAMLGAFGRIEAVEPDPLARQLCRRPGVPDVPLHDARLPDLAGVEAGGYDLVCAFDVLEHVEDDVGSLRAMRARLAPGGLMVLTVPAMPWLFGPHDAQLHHLRRYTSARFKDRVEQAGLEILRLSHFNTILFPLAVLARLLDRSRPDRAPAGTVIPAPWLNALLLRVFASETALLGRLDLPLGLSLICVARAGSNERKGPRP